MNIFRTTFSVDEHEALDAKLEPFRTRFSYSGQPLKRKEVMNALAVYLILEDLQHTGRISFKEYLAIGSGSGGLHEEKKYAALALKTYAEKLVPAAGDTKMGAMRIAFSRIVNDSEFRDPRHRSTVEATLDECWHGVDKWRK